MKSVNAMVVSESHRRVLLGEREKLAVLGCTHVRNDHLQVWNPRDDLRSDPHP